MAKWEELGRVGVKIKGLLLLKEMHGSFKQINSLQLYF